MSIEVYDNFLPDEVFTPIKDYVLGGRMPWYHSSSSVRDNDGCPQFSNLIYVDCAPVDSDMWNRIRPIFATINPIGVSRVKFNATARTPKIVKKPLHVDITGQCESPDPPYPNMPDYSICVLYINENNGYTYFEDGQKVESKENRAVIFSGDLLHAGTSCTDSDLRVVLNVDYCKWN
mgnify:FL=1|tara:strand:- start:1020 stop:1550 length:531 start_codon:yes stop_codon:yes gene_type:complete